MIISLDVFTMSHNAADDEKWKYKKYMRQSIQEWTRYILRKTDSL